MRKGPHLYPLARVIDQYPRYVALLADTNSARLFVFGLGNILGREEVQHVKLSRTQIGGWSQMRASAREIRTDEQESDRSAFDQYFSDTPIDSDTEPSLMPADLLVTLARQTGARVTFIEDTALLSSVGGVGAMLRYRI